MKRKETHIDTIIVLILLCVFSASVLMTLLFGTNIYFSMSDSSRIAYNERTCMSYIAEKFRHNDVKDSVHVGEFDGLNALFLDTEEDGVIYSDIIYSYDGWIWELYSEKGLDFLPTDGTKVIEAKSVSFQDLASGRFCVEATDLNGKTSKLTICLRSGG